MWCKCLNLLKIFNFRTRNFTKGDEIRVEEEKTKLEQCNYMIVYLLFFVILIFSLQQHTATPLYHSYMLCDQTLFFKIIYSGIGPF